MSTHQSQRAILVTLSAAGPMTVRQLAAASGVQERNAANLCSMMSGNGLLTEHPNDKGGRHGRKYGATAGQVLPADVRAVDQLVSAYGAKAIRGLVRDAARAALETQA